MKFQIKNPGKLHQRLSVPIGTPISQKDLQSALASGDTTLRKEAQFALNSKKWKHGGDKYGIRGKSNALPQ